MTTAIRQDEAVLSRCAASAKAFEQSPSGEQPDRGSTRADLEAPPGARSSGCIGPLRVPASRPLAAHRRRELIRADHRAMSVYRRARPASAVPARPASPWCSKTFALFPWLTVLQNVEAGLEARPHAGPRRCADGRSPPSTLIGPRRLSNRPIPRELSGGMRQRVGFRPRAGRRSRRTVDGRAVLSALDVLTRPKRCATDFPRAVGRAQAADQVGPAWSPTTSRRRC